MTLAVDNELREKMKAHLEINWSEVARQAFTKRIADLELFEKFQKESILTEGDAIRLGRKVNKALHKRFQKMLNKK